MSEHNLWSKKYQLLFKSLRIDYKNLLKDYLDASGINGCKHIIEENRGKSERYGWLVVMVFVLAFTFWFLLFTYIHFLEAPTATTQLPQRTSISTVPFPAVGICNGNRMSKRLLMEFATELFELQSRTNTKLGKTIDDVFNALLYLGTFYNLNSDDFKFYQLNRLHSFFTEIYNGTYSVGAMMRDLMYPCTKYLNNCVWQSQDIDCRKIFFQRKTYLGFCCLFNYQRPTVKQFHEIVKKFSKIPEVTPMYLHGPGYEMGLTVILDHDVDDYAYFINSNLGSHVFIMDPLDYADSSSGAVSNFIINVGQEMFISLHPQPVSGAQAMRDVPPRARGCQFYDENVLDYNNYYSFSECNLVCNVKSLISACGCRPFYINSLYNVSECQLSDVPCLQKYTNSRGEFNTNIKRKSSTTYGCPDCLPTCNYIRYQAQTSWSNIKQLDNTANLTDKSVLRVFYGGSHVIEYEQTVVYTWYDLLSMFGGIFGVMIGASIISVAELLYFMSGRFITLFIHKYWKQRNDSADSTKGTTIHVLYFNDFNSFGTSKLKK